MIMRLGIVAGLLAAMVGCGPSSTGPAEPEPIVIAVLPFAVEGQDHGADYVGRAFAESLAVHLARADGVTVVDIPDSTEGADRVVQGALTRVDRNVAVRVELIDPESDEVSWQSEMASESGDLSLLATTLARRTAEELGFEYPDLFEYIAHVLGSPEMSASPERARIHSAWRSNDIKGLLKLSGDLIEQFPEDADAHVINAFGHTLAWDASPDEERLVALRDRLATLDAVDPDSPYDELLRAYVYRASGEPDHARALYTRVLARDDLSNVARAWVLRQRAYTQLQVGNAGGARADAERANELDPTSAASLVALSKALESMQDVEGSVFSARRAIALEPFQWRHVQRLGVAYIRAERLDEAVEYLEQACRLSSNQEACGNLAVALQRAGRPEEARTAAAHAESLSANRWGYYNLGCYRALAGDPDAALRALDRAVGLGFANVQITQDPDLHTLRNDPRFQDLVAAVDGRLRVRREQSRSVFPWQ